jgi:hypothetical protein
LRGVFFGLGGCLCPIPLNDLTGWDLSSQDLTNANLGFATLTDTNLAGAIVTGAGFVYATSQGFTKEQLYSTASYQQKNLQGIWLGSNNLAGWDLSGQDLLNVHLRRSTLTNANLAGANITNAELTQSTLTSADLTAADMRGASGGNLAGAFLRNSILPDGRVLGLDLAGGDVLVVRDADGVADPQTRYWLTPRPPIPITLHDHFTMSDGGVLRLIFETDAWDSLISFQPGISVALGGTLELDFAPDVDVQSQVARTIQLFDWTGASPTGTFDIESPYMWDLSRLYTNGEVTLVAIPEPSAILLFLCGLPVFRRNCWTRHAHRARLMA